ncbi:BPSS1780 family membrane protein [Aquabacterium sp. A08]|uniref:BPSS1780 family membrane protein n=1 Tax=Aquabacterium sp. A08 TaxID=2718532 RepID=UPI00141E811E|nr:BPSS1780 family membrane protein [Aquabacterium sp. A08]NIC41795.1 hypothetical protein [Aquabacterium sp. A08]NIC41821.1 hypothetical protein [Aquabacterium sp. A08]NIC43494.1 hypothetical protein [Aquabacterium sp. A08]
MKLNPVPARTGLLWVQLGIRTFVRQPLALAGLFFLFMMVVSALSMLPLLGQPLALALLPAATLGLMAATREAHSGQFPMPAVLASAFRAGKDRLRAMLVLGGLYALGSFVVMGLSALLAGGGLPPVATEGGELTEAMLRQPGVLRGLVLSMLLYLPLGLLFWHAPALVHWHGVSPVKSLFFSALACWTNKGALLVYFLAWTGVFVGVSLAVVLLAGALGGPQVLAAIVFPMAMLMSAMFFSSLYFTFRDSFVTDDGQAPA